MHDRQTADSVANRARMLRTADRVKAILIVEGTDDCDVYRQFACQKRCSVQWGYGREKALLAGKILEKDTFEGFVIALDQDEWILNGGHPTEDYVVWTDGRDLESTLMFAGVMDNLLASYADLQLLGEIERDTEKGVLEHLVDWCAALGAMRWVIVRGRLGLSCKEIDAFQSVDVQTMQISVDRLAELVIDTALKDQAWRLPGSRPGLKDRLVMETGQLLAKVAKQGWLYCRGHDLCRALASGLRDTFGRRPLCASLTAEIMEANVRSAYAWSYFESTQLHGRIRSWENTNPPWRILADRRVAVQ